MEVKLEPQKFCQLWLIKLHIAGELRPKRGFFNKTKQNKTKQNKTKQLYEIEVTQNIFKRFIFQGFQV